MSGRQWTEEDREEAYMTWAYANEKNLAKTCRDLNIPERTGQYWKKEYEWDSRYAAETADIAGLAFEYGLNELRLGISAAALSLVKDASNANLEHHERLASQKLLFQLMIGSTDALPKIPTHLSLIDARSITLPAGSINDSNVIAARAIEANLSHANDLQSKRRHGKS